jgi:heme exporter protein CcmD
MDLSAPHLGYVFSAYAVTAVVLFGLIAYILMRDRRLARDVRQLDRKHDHDE